MRNQKAKTSDWSKPFKFENNRNQFNKIDTSEPDDLLQNEIEPKKQEKAKKQEIVVPKIEITKRVTQVKPFAKIPYNYIRCGTQLILPKLNSYELTEVDHSFLAYHQNKFFLGGKKILTPQLIQKVIIFLEFKAGKEIPRKRIQLKEFFEKQYKEVFRLENFQQFTNLLYNHWRNKRQIDRFPLARELWRPNPEEITYLLAFKVRDKEKMKLRRTNRMTDMDNYEILTEMFDEFKMGVKISQRIKQRQLLKYASVRCQVESFHQQCSSYMKEKPDFFQSLTSRQVIQLKEKDRNFKGDLQKLKDYQDKANTDFTQSQQINVQDNKLAVTNFVATVVHYAYQENLDYEGLFPSSISTSIPSTIPKSKPIVPAQVPPAPVSIAKEPEQTFQLSLQKCDRFLFRQTDQCIPKKISNYGGNKKNSYFQQRQREVENFYFGSDDEGDYRDLRKNISANFKRFQQLPKKIAQAGA